MLFLSWHGSPPSLPACLCHLPHSRVAPSLFASHYFACLTTASSATYQFLGIVLSPTCLCVCVWHVRLSKLFPSSSPLPMLHGDIIYVNCSWLRLDWTDGQTRTWRLAVGVDRREGKAGRQGGLCPCPALEKYPSHWLRSLSGARKVFFSTPLIQSLSLLCSIPYLPCYYFVYFTQAGGMDGISYAFCLTPNPSLLAFAVSQTTSPCCIPPFSPSHLLTSAFLHYTLPHPTHPLPPSFCLYMPLLSQQTTVTFFPLYPLYWLPDFTICSLFCTGISLYCSVPLFVQFVIHY